MSDFDGLAHRAPGLALAMLLFLLSLAGIPFVVGIGAWPQPFLESARLASIAFAA